MDGFRLESVLADKAELPPLLLIHDRSDPETPYQGSVDVTSWWPSAQLETSEGLGHRRVLRDADLVKKAVVFLAERAAADEAGSGQERMWG